MTVVSRLNLTEDQAALAPTIIAQETRADGLRGGGVGLMVDLAHLPWSPTL